MTKGFVIPQSYEWARFSSELREFIGDAQANKHEIKLRQSSWLSSTRSALADEHWLPSGVHEWAVRGMITLALEAEGQDPSVWSVEIIPFGQDAAEVDLDMAKFAY